MKLKKIVVSGLFGRFDHEIPINLADRITIMISPNGFGKTMILRLVYALLNQSFFTLAQLPFRELRLEFDDLTTISVQKKAEKAGEAETDME